MEYKPTRSQLKKQFLAGQLTPEEFHSRLELALIHRGYHQCGGGSPKWSGPFHSDKTLAEQDNAQWFDQGCKVGIYTEQR